MPEQFLHGIEIVEIDHRYRPIRAAKSSVIGVVGTAPEADAEKFPLDTPVLVAGRRSEAATLGKSGTLRRAMDGIFDQCGAMVIVVRVAGGAESGDVTSDEATISNIIGGTDDESGKRTGLQAMLDARNALGATPRIIIAPGYSRHLAVGTEMAALSERLRAVAIIDGPNTTDDDAIAYGENFGSHRAYIVDPWVRVWDTGAPTDEPASPRVAGLMAKIDNERGYWWSPSNHVINGIVGTSRGVDFAMGDVNSRANHLNENNIATIIHEDGYRLWGNRSCSSDSKWMFLNIRRTADMIGESLLQAHLWAVDRGITKTYVEDVREGVERYLRHLKKIGAILGGSCWVDPEVNTKDQISQGIVYWDFDFTPTSPAEHLVFRSHIVDDYIEEIFT